MRIHLVVLGGSRAFGTAFEDCDYDYYGIFTRPLERILSLRGMGRESYQSKLGEDDYTFHELGKFMRLALKGNPTTLDFLYSPYVVFQDDVGEQLRYMRKGFLSKRVLDSYLGYAYNQLDRFDRGVRLHSKGGQATAKFLSHAIRLLYGGIHLATTGEYVVALPVGVVEKIRSLRSGDMKPDIAIGWMQSLADDLKEKRSKTTLLPAEPDELPLERFLYLVRMRNGYPQGLP